MSGAKPTPPHWSATHSNVSPPHQLELFPSIFMPSPPILGHLGPNLGRLGNLLASSWISWEAKNELRRSSLTQDGPTRIQQSSQRAPRGLKRTPREPQEAPRGCQERPRERPKPTPFAWHARESPRDACPSINPITQEDPKSPPRGPQELLRGPQEASKKPPRGPQKAP